MDARKKKNAVIVLKFEHCGFTMYSNVSKRCRQNGKQCGCSFKIWAYTVCPDLCWNEPRLDKTNKVSVRPAKTQISLGICPVWSESSLSAWRKLGAVRMKKAWILSYPISALRRLWSDWADAQVDLSLCWAHTYLVGFVMLWLNYLRSLR